MQAFGHASHGDRPREAPPEGDDSAAPLRPRPVVTDLTRPFWEAAREGRLAAQRCDECGVFRHPPLPQCVHCRSARTSWVDLEPTGRVYQRTVMHERRVHGFENAVPYLCVAVQLDCAPELLFVGNIASSEPSEVRIGDPVVAVFDPLPGGLGLPQFAPIEGGEC